jgi:phosphoglycolate phosphatase
MPIRSNWSRCASATLRAVLFDLDGTLVNTLADVAASMNAALAGRGLATHDASAYEPWISEGVTELAERALGDASSPAEAESLVTAYRAHYASHMLDHSRPYEGIPALLDALDARGLPMAVLTNKTHAAALEVVRALFPRRFRVVLGQRAGIPQKPDPRGALEVCERLGVAPSEALLVGDSEIDVRTARRAHLRAVACTWGFRRREALELERPDVVIDRPEDLLAHIA